MFDGVVEIRNEIERSLGVEMRIIGVTGDTLLHSITDGAFGIPDMQFWKFLLILREIKLLSLNFPESISLKMISVIKKPERTKKMSTPRYPKGSQLSLR